MDRFNCGLVEVKLAQNEDTKEMTFSGYGAVFGNVDSYGDVIKKGAFKETIANAKKTNQWPVMLMQHGGWGVSADDMVPIGIYTEMSEDDHGLKLDGKLADTTRGREAYTLLKMQPRPAFNGMSIGYIPKKWSARTKPDEPRRTLEAVELLEISLVTFPANPKARIKDVKSELSIRDAERALRDVGFSQNEAKAIIADGFKSMPQRDVENIDEIVALIRKNQSILAQRG